MHTSINELLQDITAPTVERQPQVSAAPVTVTPAPDQPVQAHPPVPVAAEIKTDAPAQPVTATPTPQPQPEPTKAPVSEEMLATGADVAIGLFDFSQQNIFKFFIKRKKERKLEKVSPHWVTELEQLIQELENGKEAKSLSGEQLTMLKIEKGVREILDHLPLSDEEKKQLRVPLIEIMRQNGGVIPPNIQLMLSVLMIAGGRAADVFML